MSGLFIERVGSLSEQARADVQVQFAGLGFGVPRVSSIPGWRCCHWAAQTGGLQTFLASGDDFIAVAGTLVYDGMIGQPALSKMLDTARLPDIDWSRIGGEFTALVHRDGRSFLLCDFFAAHQIFHDLDESFFSTSLLAATMAMPRLRFDTQGLYEYAINSAALGDDTVFEGLKTLGPDRIVELRSNGTRKHAMRKALPQAVTDEPTAMRVARHRDILLATIAPYVDHFGDHMHCPLSGGLDSRLVLAALRASGVSPHIYVYGPPDSMDVQIARQIGARQGFKVECINKAAMVTLQPDGFAEQVEQNFRRFDALPNYGNIFDNGGNLLARAARHADGALVISGGCGEIFRDFFYLPDRPLSAKSLTRTFFARVSIGDVTDLFDYDVFIERLATKIGHAVGIEDPDEPMSRTIVEQLYPRVRCRALFGREISSESLLSAYAMPFLDHHMVAAALTLPMKLKHAGRFEAMLINAIDPALAAEPSAYGHDFAGAPSLHHRFSEWSSRSRPIWLRARSYAIQRKLKPMSDEHGGLLSPDYMGRVIDLEFPAMRRYFNIDRIGDESLWRRVAALEYLASRCGSRLS